MRLDKPIWKPGDRVQWFNKDTQQTGHILDLLDLDDDSWQLAIVHKSNGEWVVLSSQFLGNLGIWSFESPIYR